MVWSVKMCRSHCALNQTRQPDFSAQSIFAPILILILTLLLNSTNATMSKMASLFRPAKLDLGGFKNIRVIRDHNKRIAIEQTEPERYELN